MRKDYGFICKIKTDIRNGLEFLESFVQIDEVEGKASTILNFNAFKETPKNTEKNNYTLIDNYKEWRQKEWGCQICDWEYVSIIIGDYYYGLDMKYCIKIEKNRNDNLSLFKVESNYFEDEYEVDEEFIEKNKKKLNGSVYANYYNFLKQCKNEISDDKYECIIELNFLTNDIPMNVFKYWVTKFDMELEVEYIGVGPHECIGNIKFSWNKYTVEELDYTCGKIYFEKLIEKGYLHYDNVLSRIEQQLYEILSSINGIDTNAEDVCSNIKRGLYNLYDQPEVLANIICSTQSMYDKYLDLKEKGEEITKEKLGKKINRL